MLAMIENRAAALAPVILSVLRIMAALLLIQHGMQKIIGWPEMPAGRAMPGVFTQIWFAGIIELVGGALLLLGYYARATAFVLSGTMAFAYFLGHAPRGFIPVLNGGNLAILYCFVFLYFAFAGPGPLSLDRFLRKQA